MYVAEQIQFFISSSKSLIENGSSSSVSRGFRLNVVT